MKPAWNPVTVPESTQKLNFAQRPKQNFGQVNSSDVETRVSSRRNVSSPR